MHGLPALALKSGQEEQRSWERKKSKEKETQRETRERTEGAQD